MSTPAHPDPCVAGLLMAGGRSRRMGQDKAQLDWHGRPLGEHQAATLTTAGAAPLFLSCRADQPWTPAAFTRLEDRAEGGALDALVDALNAIPNDVVLVLAIDLPLVQSTWLISLATRAATAGVSVVPLRDGRFEPFAAAWHRSALPLLRATLAQSRSLQSACAELQTRGQLQPLALNTGEAASLANLNSPGDVARVGSLA